MGGKEGGRKLSGYDSRRPRRRGELGGTQPPAFEAEIQGPKIARASTPDITLPQHGIWGVSGMGERKAWSVRPYKYADGGHHRVLRPPSQASRNIRSSRPLSLASTSYSSRSLRSYHPSPARPANSSYGSDRSQSSNVQPTNFLSVCPPVCAPVG